MASRKKKKTSVKKQKEFLRRSQASKKGWETRRKNLARERKKRANAEKIIEGLKPALQEKLAVKKPKKKKKETELQRLKRENEELKKKLEKVEDENPKWVDVLPIEYLHQDGTIALEKCWLRHLGNVTAQLRANLDAAAAEGKFELQMEAEFIAEKFDVTLREVYTLFYSP